MDQLHGNVTIRLEELLPSQVDDPHATNPEPFPQEEATDVFPSAESVGFGREGEGEGHQGEHQ
jgi:hypothetical protein